MQIDARTLDLQEILQKLREVLKSSYGCDVTIDIMVSTEVDTKKITAFATMSGCKVVIDKKDDYYIMRVRGIACCT